MEKKTRRVLVVDDDQPIRIILKNNLAKQGFEVRVAEDGEKALESLSDFRPDVIVSDIIMPKMDGYKLCRAIRKTMGEYYRNIPFIFLTAKTDSRSVIQGFRHGADDYITKPFDVAEVISRVNAMIDKIRLADRVQAETAFSGKIAEIAVSDILQIVEIGRKTGKVTIMPESNSKGEITFQDGFIVGARSGNYRGQDAVYHLLTINNGEFFFEVSKDIDIEMEPLSVTHVLMEGMRIIDELSQVSRFIPEGGDLISVNIEKIKGLKQKFDDPDTFKILSMMDDGIWRFSDIIDKSSMGQIKTGLVVAKLISKGLFFVRKASEDKTSEGILYKMKNYGSVLIAGCGDSADWFLNTVITGLNMKGVKKTEGLGVGNFYNFSQSDGSTIRFCTVRGERRFHNFWKELLEITDIAIYFCNSNDITFIDDVESFLRLAGSKGKVVLIREGETSNFIISIAEIFNCRYHIFKDEVDIVKIFKNFFIFGEKLGVGKE